MMTKYKVWIYKSQVSMQGILIKTLSHKTAISQKWVEVRIRFSVFSTCSSSQICKLLLLPSTEYGSIEIGMWHYRRQLLSFRPVVNIKKIIIETRVDSRSSSSSVHI